MSSLLGRSLRAAGLAVAACLAAPAWAAPEGMATRPTYEDLIARLDQMPAAIEARALSEAADARARQARALLNPSIAVGVDNAYGSGPYAGRNSAEDSLALIQPLELWGKRGARIAVADAAAGAAGLRGEQRRWMTAAVLAQAYSLAEARVRRYDLSAEALSLIEADARAIDALVREGRQPKLRSIQAQSEVEAARAALDEAGALKSGALARLGAVALADQPLEGVGNSLLERVPATLPATTGEPLAVRIAEADLATASRQIKVEKRRALTDVSASVGARRFRATDERAMNIGLTLSVPLFDRNRGNISAAYAEERAAEARLLAQRQQVQADRLAAQAALAASNTRTRAADSGVTAAEEAYRLARVGFDAGRISQLELRSARTALISARNVAVDARMSRVLAEIELAQLEGRAPFVETP
ncbi:MAG TPA: TolC family protein [Stenotrophomonas sp.]|nr:TolC family protein [Stenotrophomonas sp.]